MFISFPPFFEGVHVFFSQDWEAQLKQMEAEKHAEIARASMQQVGGRVGCLPVTWVICLTITGPWKSNTIKKNGGSFWMLINPLLKFMVVRKPTYKNGGCTSRVTPQVLCVFFF